MRGLRQAAAACVAVLALAGSTGISLAQDLSENLSSDTTLEIFPAPLSANLLAKRQAYFEATQPQLTESLLAIVYTLAMGLSIGATATVARRTGERIWPDVLLQPVSIATFATLITASLRRHRAGNLTWRGRPLP